MNRIIKYFLVLVVIMFCGCIKRIAVTLSDLPPVYVPDGLDTVIEIKKWLALGPFEFDPQITKPIESFLKEDLKQFGIEEGGIDDIEIKKMHKKGTGVFVIEETTPKIRLVKYIRDSIENKSNFYLVAKINSAKTQDVALILDGSHSYAGWLNGKKLIEIRFKYNTGKVGDRFINVSLIEGENILFFKVNRGTNLQSWDLCCAIAPLHEAKRIFCVNYTGDFVVNPLVNDSIKIYTGPYLSGKVEVVDIEEHIVVANSSFNKQDTNDRPFIISGLNRLRDGFYRVTLTVGDEKLREMIFKGNYDSFIEKARINVGKITNNRSYIGDLNATMHVANRFKDRGWDANSPSDMRYVAKNRVFWGYSFYKLLHNVIPSTHIMTYMDEDGHSGEFIFHNSNERKRNIPIPLIVVVPYALNGDSLRNDWYVSNLDQMEPDHALADQYGFALAWIYAGGKNYSADRTEKEIAAIIKRLELDYNIDSSNIFIFGECEGGRRALVQLSMSPERYAACAVSSPITLSGGFNEAPINLVPLMKNTPVIIMHGTNDEVISVENSRRFVAKYIKYGLSVKYIENDYSHIFVNKDIRRFAFEYFSKIGKERKN